MIKNNCPLFFSARSSTEKNLVILVSLPPTILSPLHLTFRFAILFFSKDTIRMNFIKRFLILFVLLCSFVTAIMACQFEEEHAIELTLDSENTIAFKIDLSQKEPSETDSQAIEGIRQKTIARLKAYGTESPIVQSLTNDQGSFILVYTGGIKDIESAKSLIKKTGKLDFRETIVDEFGFHSL